MGSEYGRALVEQQEGRPEERLKAMIDAILDDLPEMPASVAAESAADQLGLFYRRIVSLGRPACDVAIRGQKPPPIWKKILCFGMTMWESGTWITISDDYRGDPDKAFFGVTGWPLAHSVVYR